MEYTLCFRQGQIWGNLISYLVLQSTAKPATESGASTSEVLQKSIVENSTNATIRAYQCGAQFTDKEFHVAASDPVPKKLVGPLDCDDRNDHVVLLLKVFTLCYIYIGLAVASIVLVAIFLDQRRTKTEAKSESNLSCTCAISLRNANTSRFS